MMATDGSCNSSSSLLFNTSDNCISSSGMPQTSSLYPWYITAVVIIAISCLLGVPANITVIAKLSRHLHRSSISQRLFFNLAMSDLLCLFCLSVGAIVFISGPRVTHGVCQLFFYVFFFGLTSNINILVLISIQRYCQVLHPKQWAKVGRLLQRFLLLTVWILGALVALPVVFSLTDVKVQKWNDGESCKNKRIPPALQVVYMSYIAFSYVVLFSFYLLLVRGVSQIQMPNKKKPRAHFLIRIIAVYLLIGFFPLIFHAVHIVALFTASENLLHISRKLTLLVCIYFFSHCLNPFLYFFASVHNRGKINRKTQGGLRSNTTL